MTKNAERIKELEDQIKINENKAYELKIELRQLQWENEGYFIEKTISKDWSHGREYYTPLGHISEPVAEFWCKKKAEGDIYYNHEYFEVSHEIYMKYLKAGNAYKIMRDLELGNYDKLDNYYKFHNALEKYVDDLFYELRLSYRIGEFINTELHISKEITKEILK